MQLITCSDVLRPPNNISIQCSNDRTSQMTVQASELNFPDTNELKQEVRGALARCVGFNSCRMMRTCTCADVGVMPMWCRLSLL